MRGERRGTRGSCRTCRKHHPIIQVRERAQGPRSYLHTCVWPNPPRSTASRLPELLASGVCPLSSHGASTASSPAPSPSGPGLPVGSRDEKELGAPHLTPEERHQKCPRSWKGTQLFHRPPGHRREEDLLRTFRRKKGQPKQHLGHL